MNNDYNNNQQPQYQPPQPPAQPGRNLAIASLIMGIASIALCWAGYGAIICIGFGVAATICGSKAKKQGFVGGMATAGMVTGIIGAILSAVVFILCTVVACIVGAGAAASGIDFSSLY